MTAHIGSRLACLCFASLAVGAGCSASSNYSETVSMVGRQYGVLCLRIREDTGVPRQVAVWTVPGAGYSDFLFLPSAELGVLAVESRGLFVVGVDPATGVLLSTPSSPAVPPSTPSFSALLAADPAGAYLYSAGRFTSAPRPADNVEAYRIGADGTLSLVAGSPFTSEGLPVAMAVASSGAHLAVANMGTSSAVGSIAVLALDASTGGLQEAVGSPYLLSISPDFARFDPAGDRALLVSNSTSQIQVAGVASDTPVEGPVLGVTLPGSVVDAAFSSDGSSVYVIMQDSAGGGWIATLHIDSSSRALSPIGGEPLATNGFAPEAVFLDRDERFVYVLQSTSGGVDAVAGFAINSDGTLRPLPGSPFPL